MLPARTMLAPMLLAPMMLAPMLLAWILPAPMMPAEFAQPASRRLYLVAEEGRALIGYAGMMFTGGSQADVVTLAVNPARWGEGTGTALLTALVDEAEKRGYEEVLLEVREDNPRARQLYLRHGFAEIGLRRGYYQPSGVNAVVMRKALA